MSIVMNAILEPKDEIQTVNTTECPVFIVTDLLKDFQYIVADKGSHFEIYPKIIVSRNADIIEAVDRLVRCLTTGVSSTF